MKLEPWQRREAADGRVHRYCLQCSSSQLTDICLRDRLTYRCAVCGSTAPRALIIDPEVAWWTDAVGEYWHATAGVFVRDNRNRFLFFQRTAFPFAMTVPAGHLRCNEDPLQAGRRELLEETGLRTETMKLISRKVIPGEDRCRRGSDSHQWHTYLLSLDGSVDDVTLNAEGESPVWLTLTEVNPDLLTYAVRALIYWHSDALTAR